MNEQGTEDYAAAVRKKIEDAIHAAGFPGHYTSDEFTMEHLARIACACEASVSDWFPDLAGLADPQPESQPQVARQVRRPHARVLRRRWGFLPSAS